MAQSLTSGPAAVTAGHVADQPGAPAREPALGRDGGGSEAYVKIRDLYVQYGDNTVVNGVSFDVHRGQHLSLLGPSGCGKTTLLRCITGLETPVSGEIEIDGKVVYSSSRRINVPTEKRELSLMFQSYAIWPHMTVFDNVAYGLRRRSLKRGEIADRVQEVLAMVHMEQFADVKATQLSGGQQQRVALARSYAHPPKALLLDEPLSNLDARLRDQMLLDLRRFQRETNVTTIYVTHDQGEAMGLSDRIIVMRDGLIVQDGPPTQIYHSPRTRFVADFIGAANIIEGTECQVDEHPGLDIGATIVRLQHRGERQPEPGSRRLAAIRTIHPQLRRERGELTVNVWAARIERVTMFGDFVDLVVGWAGSPLRVKALSTEQFIEGEEIYVHIPPDQVVLLDDAPTEEPT